MTTDAFIKRKIAHPSVKQLQLAGYVFKEERWQKAGEKDWEGGSIETYGPEVPYMERAKMRPEIQREARRALEVPALPSVEPTLIKPPTLPQGEPIKLQTETGEEVTGYIQDTGEVWDADNLLVGFIEPITGDFRPATIEDLLPEGWNTYEEADGRITYLRPDGWRQTEEGGVIDPEGIEYTPAQVEESQALREQLEAMFPDTDIQEMRAWAEEDPERFINFFQDAGDSTKTRAVLKRMGVSDAGVDTVIYPPGVVVDRGGAVTADGQYLEQGFFDNVWQQIQYNVPQVIHKSAQYFVSTLPNKIFADVKPGQRTKIQVLPFAAPEWGLPYSEEEAARQNQFNKEMRDKFRVAYTRNQAKHEEWLEKNKELEPPDYYKEGALEHPELWHDAGYWGSVIGEAAPFSLAILGVTAGTFFATKNPYTAVLAGTAFATPYQSQDLYDDLVASGAPEGEAAKIAVPVGAVIASVEAVTDLPLVSAIFAPLKIFGKQIIKEVQKRTVWELLKRGVKTFSIVEISEVMEEIVQGAIQNAFVREYDKDRAIFENIDETIIKTLIATAPFAVFGGGMSMRHVSSDVAEATSPEQKGREGWVQDNITGEWYKPLVLTEGIKEDIARSQEAGLTGDEAKVKAYNEAARSEEGAEAIEKATQKIKKGEPLPEEPKAIPVPEVPEVVEGVKEPWQMIKEEFNNKIFPTPTIGARYDLLTGQEVVITGRETVGLGALWTISDAKTGRKIGDITTPDLNKAVLGGERATTHKGLINKALSEGKVIPAEVLAEYPDLAAKAPKAAEAVPEKVKPVVEKPAPPPAEPTMEEAISNLNTPGGPTLTSAQIDSTLKFFADYIAAPTTESAWELTRQLRQETQAQRAESLKARAQELIITEGVPVEEAMRQAITETMSGELPSARSEYMDSLTQKMRDALFDKVYKELKDYPYEMMSTADALTNALLGKPIPRKKGKGSLLFPEGGSAWDRLNYVFGKDIIKAIDKLNKDGKTLEGVTKELYGGIGKPPIPLDEETVNYVRAISKNIKDANDLAIIKAYHGKYPSPSHEKTISDAAKEVPMWPTPARDAVIKALKEIAYLPIDIGNFLRANKASFDFSFWRQQAPLILNHKTDFTMANVDAWKAIWSQKSAEASWERIVHDPLYHIYDQIGVDFLRPLELPAGTSQWKGVEEFGYLTGERVLPRLTSKIPWVKISARAFVTGTNAHNWLIFKNHYNAMLRLNEKYASGEKKLKAGEAFSIEKEMTDFAKLLTDFSARGQLGKAAPLAPALGSLLFAPRMILGRVLSPRHLISANPRIRIEAWKDLVTFVGGLGGLILLGAKLDLWDVEKDPRSAEYMSIREGNTRIDPWGGYRQYLVFLTRVIDGTGISSVTGAEYEIDPQRAMMTFVKGKAAPLASIIMELVTGKTFIGEDVDVANVKQWVERLAPFAIWDMYEAFMDDPSSSLWFAIPAILGAGVQTYTGDWAENWPKMGLPKYPENLDYGITEPVYDVKDFWADTSSQFKGVDPETLTKEKGFPPYIKAIAEARIVSEGLAILPNEKLTSMNADSAIGATFADYYQMWQDRQKIVASGDEEKLKEFDTDERTRNAHLGNFSQREYSLLIQYHSITDKVKQAAFLDRHPELSINPRQEWLRTHPKENAKLAIWGQAKVLTQAAYDEAQRLIGELDIPDIAVEEYLPPKHLAETHFKYEDLVGEGRHGSYEAQLLLLEDFLAAEEAGEQSFAEWHDNLGVSDKEVEYLKLRVNNQELFDKLEAFKDEDSPEYKDDTVEDENGLTARDRALEELRATKVGDETFGDVERRIDAMGKGTRANPIPKEVVDAYVTHMQLVDKTSGSSAESNVNRYDNPELNAFLMDKDLHGDNALKPLDESRVPIWRLDEQYRKEDTWYDEGIVKKHEEIAYATEDERADAIRAERKQYLKGNDDYAVSKRRREAMEFGFNETYQNAYIDYYMNYASRPDDYGLAYYYEDDWFLMEHFGLEKAMVDAGAWTKYRDYSKVPTKHVFNVLYPQWLRMGATDRRAFEAKHPDLDMWLHLTTGTKLESEKDKEKAEPSPPAPPKPPGPEEPEQLVVPEPPE